MNPSPFPSCFAQGFAKRPQFGLPLLTLLMSAPFAAAQSTWNADAADNWSNAARWTGGIPDATGAVANFRFNITAGRTVTINTTSRTVGTLRFEDLTTANADWTLAASGGGQLILDVASGNNQIIVSNRTATISAPIASGATADPIVASGAGVLVLTGANLFTNTFTVASGGTVNLGNANALGATGAGNETIVTAGGTLNVNGTAVNPLEVIRIAGFGSGTSGAALLNNGAGQTNALNNVTLTANAGIGGSGRFDIRTGASPTLDLAGFRLTKIGANQFSVVNGTITQGNIDVAAGTFSIEANTAMTGSGLLTINSGATLGLWANASGAQTRTVLLNGAVTELGQGATATLSTPLILNGAGAAVNSGMTGAFVPSTTILNGGISESRMGTPLLKGASGGIIQLAAPATFTGALTASDNPASGSSRIALAAGSSLATRQLILGNGVSFDSSAVGGYAVPWGGTFQAGRTGAAANDVIGNLAVSGATLNAGALLAVRTMTFANDLTFNNAALNLDLGSTAGAGQSDFLSVTGALAAAGVNRINLMPAAGQDYLASAGFAAGPYTLATATGGATGTAANYAIGNASNYRQTFSIDTTTVPGSVLLNVAGSAMASNTWDNTAGTNIWKTNADANWNGGDKFYDLDDTFFQDNGNPLEDIKIVGNVFPSRMLFDSGNFKFSGTGRISGPNSVTHSSSGKATFFSDTHDFTGSVNINGGTVAAVTLHNNFFGATGGPTSLGQTTNPIVIDNGTLEYLGGTATAGRTIQIGGAGHTTGSHDATIKVTDALSHLVLSTALGTGAGNTVSGLVKTGNGVLQIGANVTFPGNITVNGGVLRAGTVAALQSKTVTVNPGATFDPNGLSGAAAPRPALAINGMGIPGLAAIWNTGAGVTNNPLYNIVTLNGDASIGSVARWDFNGAGGLTFNGGTFTLHKVGVNESWWAPLAGATVGDINVVGGLWGVQSTDNLGSTAHSIIVRPGGTLGSFGAGTSNVKPVVMDGGEMRSTGGAATDGQHWRGGVTLTRNSFINNNGTAVNNQIALDSIGGGNNPLSLNGQTWTKIGAKGTLFLRNTGAVAGGSGDGSVVHYAGTITQQNGFSMNGAGQLVLKSDAIYNIDDTGAASTLTKEVRFDGGALVNFGGTHTTGPVVLGGGFSAHGGAYNTAAGTTLTLGNLTAGANSGMLFGLNGSVALTTVNGSAPAVGAGNRLGVDWTAGNGATIAAAAGAAGFATWDGTAVGVLPTTVLGAGSGAGDDVLNTAAYTLAASQTVRTLVSSADVSIPTGMTLKIADGGIVMRGANHSINTAAGNTGTLTTGAADGRLVINTPEHFEVRGTLNLRAQIIDQPLTGGGFKPLLLVKQGNGQFSSMGVDNGANNMLNNLYTGGSIINNGRVAPNGLLGLGTGTVWIRDGGQLALFSSTGSTTAGSQQASYVPNNIVATGWGAGENAGYLGAIRMAQNVNVSGNLAVSGDTRLHNQNGQGAISGIISGTGRLQHTGNNISWITNPASTFSGVLELGFRDQNGAATMLVSRLSDGGQPSSIGAATSDAANLVINGGVLRYVGPGDSTDRLFTLGSGFNIGGVPSVIVSASGYGALHFTNPGNLGVTEGSIRNLVLRAENLATGAIAAGGVLPENTFAPVLTNPTGANRANYNTLTKDGIGTWTLLNAQAYGVENPNITSTSISNGVLRLSASGNLGVGVVGISNNAKLQINRTDGLQMNNTFTGNANGDAEIQQIGAGTTLLGGVSDNGSMKVRVNNGTLELAKQSSPHVHAAALLATVNGGTLKLGGTGNDQIFDGATNGVWTTVQMNGGTFDLNGRDEAVYRVEGKSGVITNSSAGTTSRLVLGGSLPETSAVTGGVALGNGSSLIGGGVGSAIQNGAGVVSVEKTGTGQINLTGANTYSGVTTVHNGILSIGNGGTTGTLGTGAVTVGSTGILGVNRSNAYIFNHSVSGDGSFAQMGTGTTTVVTPLAHKGFTYVNSGMLSVHLAASNNVLPTLGTLLLNGGRAQFVGGSGGTSTQTLSSVTIAGGDLHVDGSSGLTTVNLPGSFTRNPGGSVNFSQAGFTALNSTVANTNGIVATTAAAYATLNGQDWAAGNGASIVPVAGYAVDAYAPGNHTDITVPTVLGAATTTSTIRFNTPAAAALALGGNTLQLDQGGILVTPNITAGASISGGTLTGAAAAGSEVLVHHHGNASLAGAVTIFAVIANNGVNATGFTKAGGGIVALAGANSYTGATHVNQGTLAVGAFGTTGNLGSGPVVNDATLAFARTDAVTVNNQISGSGQVAQVGGGTLTLGAANTFTGGLLVTSGTVRSDRGFGGGSNATGGLFAIGGGTLYALANTDPANAAGIGSITMGDASTAGPVAFLSDSGADFANPIVVSALGTGSVTIGSTNVGATPVNPAMFLGDISIGRATTLQGGNPDRTTFLGSISGTGDLIIANGGSTNGRVTLENDNSFVGNVIVNDSTVLQVGTGAFAAPRNQIPDTADVTLGAGSQLRLNGDSETINTLNSTATNSVVDSIAGGTQVLTILNGGTFNGVINGSNGNGQTVEVAGGTFTIGGTTDNGSGRLMVTGGTAVLNKVSTTGVHAAAVDLTIAGGTVKISGSFSGALPTSYGAGVTLPGNFVDQIYDGSAGASSTTVINSGTLDLNGFSEGIGRLDGYGGTVTNNGAAPSTLFVGTTNHSNLFTAGYAGTIQDGTGTLALHKVTNGIAIFSGDLKHTGGTTISAGSIQIGNGGTGGTIAGDINVVSRELSSLIFNRAGSLTVPGIVSGAGHVISNGAGTIIFTGANSYTGLTAINAGVLQIGDGGSSGSLGTGNVTVQSGAILKFNRSNALTVSALLSGGGQVEQNGAGTTTLTGIATHSGQTIVNSGVLKLDSAASLNGSPTTVNATGTLEVNGAVNGALTTVNAGGTLKGSGILAEVSLNGGTIAPGNSPGTLTTGNFLSNSSSLWAMELDIAGTVGSGVNDLVQVNGTLTLDGTLQVLPLTNFSFGTYRLINYTGALTDNTLDLEPSFLSTYPGSTVDTSVPNQVNLVVVPEPAGPALVAAVASFLLLRRRRGAKVGV